MFRLPVFLVLIATFGVIGCRHRGSCDDRSCIQRLRDRMEDRREGTRRDPGPGANTDRAVPPGVIPPRGERIPATPLPVTPDRSFSIDPNPARSSQKMPVDLPPETIPSDPVLVVPPGPSNRTTLLPDPLLVDPLLRAAPPKVEQTPDGLGEPILPGGESPTTAVDPKTILLPETGLKPKSDLPSDLPPPVGVESFAPVPGQEKVASGKKPTLEGLNALKSQGYKTIVYLHAPEADTTAAKETVEKRGLRFTAIPVSPQKLSEASKAFAELVKDSGAKPLFVYDLDGVRAGSLWYVHFRTVEMLSDEVARIRAGALGLRESSASEEQKQFWIAIQDLLAKR